MFENRSIDAVLWRILASHLPWLNVAVQSFVMLFGELRRHPCQLGTLSVNSVATVQTQAQPTPQPLSGPTTNS